MNNVTKAIALIIIALYLPYCSGRGSGKAKTYDAGIALSVEEDILRAAIQRRLYALEQIKFQPIESAEKPSIQPVSASEAVHQK